MTDDWRFRTATTTNSSTGTASFYISNSDAEVNRLKEEIRQLKEQLAYRDAKEITQKEWAFILSRVHPDKNVGSKMAHELTLKLLKERKK
tara:strand:+ start:242 stop:511 length:270 start_codon:yes stop_codon:yes gene_type:complete